MRLSSYSYLISALLHFLVALVLITSDVKEAKGTKAGGSANEKVQILVQYQQPTQAAPTVKKSDVSIKKKQQQKRKRKEHPDCRGAKETNWYGGIGIQTFHGNDGTETIDTAYEGYPAAEAGLVPGDKIVSILEGGPDIRGEPGSKLTLVILKNNDNKPFTISLIRAKVCFRY